MCLMVMHDRAYGFKFVDHKNHIDGVLNARPGPRPASRGATRHVPSAPRMKINALRVSWPLAISTRSTTQHFQVCNTFITQVLHSPVTA